MRELRSWLFILQLQSKQAATCSITGVDSLSWITSFSPPCPYRGASNGKCFMCFFPSGAWTTCTHLHVLLSLFQNLPPLSVPSAPAHRSLSQDSFKFSRKSTVSSSSSSSWKSHVFLLTEGFISTLTHSSTYFSVLFYCEEHWEKMLNINLFNNNRDEWTVVKKTMKMVQPNEGEKKKLRRWKQ